MTEIHHGLPAGGLEEHATRNRGMQALETGGARIDVRQCLR
jgi:hypothetical protein